MKDEREYVIEAIGAFLNGSGGEWDWDDFTSCPLYSAKLDSIRRRANAIYLPLDMAGEAILKELLNEAEQVSEHELTKPRPWRMETGMIGGALVGALVCWISYVPGTGLLQNLKLILFPLVIGILIVSIRNKRQKVGAYDPETIARNRQGRL